MTSLGPGCALGILFVCVEDQNYVGEAHGQAQHPALSIYVDSPFKVNRTCRSLHQSNRRANSSY